MPVPIEVMVSLSVPVSQQNDGAIFRKQTDCLFKSVDDAEGGSPLELNDTLRRARYGSQQGATKSGGTCHGI